MAEINLGFENKLWEMADKLRGNIESAEYKHIVLGLIFLKYISDAFEEKYNELVSEGDGFEEDEDFYLADNIFYVPEKARWQRIKNAAHTPDVGVYIDEAMREIEKKNAELMGVLPKNYARPEIDTIKLGELIDLFSFNIGSREARAKDTLGRVYEYFLGKFGSSEGEFYTPPSIVKLLVNMIEPKRGKVYDPCCGSGGMFVQSQKFVEEYGGYKHDILVFGQEYTATTWRLCKMNLAVRGVNGDIGTRDGDTFANDMHRDRKMDYILANPPFNVKDYFLNPEDARWKYGIPPKNNANYAWIQHIISKLSHNGVAGFVLANGSMSTSNKQEAEIRQNIIEAGLVDCIVAMPTNLFYNVTIPVCLWFLSKKRDNRKDKILFIDAREMGEMVTRVHRELSDEDIQKVCRAYHAYRDGKDYEDISGFCKTATLDEVRKNDYVLTPGRYVEGTQIGLLTNSYIEFKTYNLSDIATIKYGKNQSKVVAENGTVPIYGTGGLMGYATEALYDKPSVLIGRKGTIDKIRYVEHPFWTVDTLFYTQINTDIVIPYYLYCLLKTIDLTKYNEGTTIPSLRTETLNKLRLNIPSIEEQEKVVKRLKVFDDKIRINNTENIKLAHERDALLPKLMSGEIRL